MTESKTGMSFSRRNFIKGAAALTATGALVGCAPAKETLAETGEEIYHSGLMPVDSHIQTDKLDVELEAGEYDAIATFHAYDVETDAEIGAAIAQIRISVLS